MNSKTTLGRLAFVFLSLAAAAASGQNFLILPGGDLFKSPPGLNSEYDLGECMIPGEYFEIGTPPLTGCELPLVPEDPEDPMGPQSFLLGLQGVPIETYLNFDVGGVDTIVLRKQPLNFGPNPQADVTRSTDIELVALKLISTDPIEITCDQGVTRWIAEVEVDQQTGPSLGTMDVTLDHPALVGGTASSTLAICPRVTFRRIDPGSSGSFDLFPCDMLCGPELVGETTWSFESPAPDNSLVVPGLTTDNFFFTELLSAEELLAVESEKLATGCNPDCPCIFKYPHLSENHVHQACLPCPCDVDDLLPTLEPPADKTVECTEEGGTSRFATCIDPDPDAGTLCILDWLDSVTCNDQPIDDASKISSCEAFGPPSFFEAGCDPGKETEVEFVAVDSCCNEAADTASLFVRDTLPPEVEAGAEDLYCVGPPNHEYVCFDRSQFTPQIDDICDGDVSDSWRFVDCASDQPDNGNGDGDTVNDCQVTCDGEVICVRAERQAPDPDDSGRRYAVKIEPFDDCGNVGTAEVIGFIHVPENGPYTDCIAPPELDAQCDAEPTGGDAPLAVDFSDESTSTGEPISMWEWDFGDGNTSTLQNPSHTYAEPGIYTPTLMVSTGPAGMCNPSTGQSDFATCPQIDVALPPPTCEAVPTSGDAPLNVQFNGQSSFAGVAWSWDFGDGNTSTDQNPSHTYAAAGSFTPTVTISLNGQTASATCPVIDVAELDCELPPFTGPGGQNNGAFLDIDIGAELGITGNIVILSIRQDEPIRVNNGDQCPDGEIDGSIARVRLQRLGGGDGRFYHIDFTVDGVRICGDAGLTKCIPRGNSCVDGGALFDSTGPCS